MKYLNKGLKYDVCVYVLIVSMYVGSILLLIEIITIIINFFKKGELVGTDKENAKQPPYTLIPMDYSEIIRKQPTMSSATCSANVNGDGR